jgi:hypothetical protein
MKLTTLIRLIKEYLELKFFLKILSKYIGNKRVAIVGSGRNLLRQKSGKKINNYDLVARFNLAPTKKYEIDAGRKTDIIVTNHLYFVGIRFNKFHMDIKKIRNKLIIVIVDHPDKKHKYFLEKNIKKYCNRSNKVIFFNNYLNSHVRSMIIKPHNYSKKIFYFKKIKKFSGGLLFISFLNLLNKNFSIFGFDLNKKQNKVSYYYKKSGWNKKIPGVQHNFEKENKIIKSLVNEY